MLCALCTLTVSSSCRAQNHAEVCALAEAALTLVGGGHGVLPASRLAMLAAAVGRHSAPGSPSSRADTLCACLLLQALHAPALLAARRDEASLAAHPLVCDDARRHLPELDAALERHFPDAVPHAAVGLGWAAWLCLAGGMPGDGAGMEAGPRLGRAQRCGLAALRALVASAAEEAGASAGCARSGRARACQACLLALRATLAALLAACPLPAFQLLWCPITRQLCCDVLCALCDALPGWARDELWWGGDAASAELTPLRSLLQACCEAFPASPAPLLRCLAASAGTGRGARAAWHYLAGGLTLLALDGAAAEAAHPGALGGAEGGDAAAEGEGGLLVARGGMAAPLGWHLAVPPGSLGERRPGYLPASPGAPPADCLLFRVSPAYDAALALCARAAQLLRAVPPAGGPEDQELQAALTLLDRCCALGRAAVAVEVLSRRLPALGATGGRRDTLLAALAAGADGCCRDAALCARLAAVLQLLGSLARLAPRAVLASLDSAALLAPSQAPSYTSSATLTGGALPRLAEHLLRVEPRCPGGAFPVSCAAAQLLGSLASRGVVPPALLAHVACALLPLAAAPGPSAAAPPAARWRLHAACCSALLATLRAAPPPGVGGAQEGALGRPSSAVQLASAARTSLGALFAADSGAVEGLLAPMRAACDWEPEVGAAESEVSDDGTRAAHSAALAAALHLLPCALAACGAWGGCLGLSCLGCAPGPRARPSVLPAVCAAVAAPATRAAALQALLALSAAAAAASPPMQLTPALLCGGAVDGADGAAGGPARAALLAPLSPAAAGARPEDATAVCALLASGATQHPALVEWLMLPSSGDASSSSSPAQQPSGALDALLECLRHAEVLRRHAPRALAAALHALSGAAAGRGACGPAAHALRSQPRCWTMLLGCVTVDSGGGTEGEHAAPAGGGDGDEDDESGASSARWAAAASALRILLDGELARPLAAAGGGGGPGEHLREWCSDGGLRSWLNALQQQQSQAGGAVHALACARRACGSLTLRVAARRVAAAGSHGRPCAELGLDAALCDGADAAAQALLASPAATAVLAGSGAEPPAEAAARLLSCVSAAWASDLELDPLAQVQGEGGAQGAAQGRLLLTQLLATARRAGAEGAALRVLPQPAAARGSVAEGGAPWDADWLHGACGEQAEDAELDADVDEEESLPLAAAAAARCVRVAAWAVAGEEAQRDALRATRALVAACGLQGRWGAHQLHACALDAASALQRSACQASQDGCPEAEAALGDSVALVMVLTRAWAGAASASGSKCGGPLLAAAVANAAAPALGQRCFGGALSPAGQALAGPLCTCLLLALETCPPSPSEALRAVAPQLLFVTCAALQWHACCQPAAAALCRLVGARLLPPDCCASLLRQHLPPLSQLPPEALTLLAGTLARSPEGAAAAVSAGGAEALSRCCRGGARLAPCLSALAALLATAPPPRAPLVACCVSTAAALGPSLALALAPQAPLTPQGCRLAASAGFFAAQLAGCADGDWELAAPGGLTACRAAAAALLEAVAAAPDARPLMCAPDAGEEQPRGALPGQGWDWAQGLSAGWFAPTALQAADGDQQRVLPSLVARELYAAAAAACAFLLALARSRPPRRPDGTSAPTWPSAHAMRGLNAQLLKLKEQLARTAGDARLARTLEGLQGGLQRLSDVHVV